MTLGNPELLQGLIHPQHGFCIILQGADAAEKSVVYEQLVCGHSIGHVAKKVETGIRSMWNPNYS